MDHSVKGCPWVSFDRICLSGRSGNAASGEQSRVPALGKTALRCRWQMKQGGFSAAVDKIEDQRKPDDFIGHRKPAAKPRMPRVRVSPLGPQKKNRPLWSVFFISSLCPGADMRHPASKAGHLLWAKTLCAADGRWSRAFCVQRSTKSRECVSPKILSGTANWRRSRGCREFESRHLDQISRNGFMPFLLISFECETRKIKCGADERRRRGLDRADPLSAP